VRRQVFVNEHATGAPLPGSAKALQIATLHARRASFSSARRFSSAASSAAMTDTTPAPDNDIATATTAIVR
jgi:hypothetical protein